MKIYFWHIDEEHEWVAIHEKGDRHDIVVQVGENYYPQINCVGYKSFIMRCNLSMERKNHYIYSPDTILVQEVTQNSIVETLIKWVEKRNHTYLIPYTYQQVRDLYSFWYKDKPGMGFCDDWYVVYDDGKD